jgi:hypothetical protein
MGESTGIEIEHEISNSRAAFLSCYKLLCRFWFGTIHNIR